jgi:hypothetical protein
LKGGERDVPSGLLVVRLVVVLVNRKWMLPDQGGILFSFIYVLDSPVALAAGFFIIIGS